MDSRTPWSRIGIGMLLLMTYGATPSAQYTTLVGTVGTDTVAVDRFTRNTTTLEGVVFVRRPQPHTMHYKAALAPEGRFSRVEIIWRDAKGVEMRTANISFGVDSIRTEMKGTTALSIAAGPTLDAIPLPPQPYSSHAYSTLEHAAMMLLLTTNRPAAKELEWIVAGNSKAAKHRVTRVAGDTVEIDYVGGQVRALLGNKDRRLIAMSIGGAPQLTLIRRSASDINIARLTAAYAARDGIKAPVP
jgi:hypothetical protein